MQTLDMALQELAKKGLIDPPPAPRPGMNGAANGAPAPA